MIDFHRLHAEKDSLRKKFLSAQPFPHIAIDNFLIEGAAEILHDAALSPKKENQVNDYFFTKNKFQFPDYKHISSDYMKLYNDISSDEFISLIKYISNENVFIDADFYGGGLHLGTKNSYLDMHADFNYHPKHTYWYRNLNLLLYLNKDWKPEYGGSLKLKDSRSGQETEIEPLLNRLVIMHCRSYTLHGYDTTHFPEGKNRTSIALYGYTLHEKHIEIPRTTLWVSEANLLKKVLSKLWLPASIIKKKFMR